jgi:FkbM family methyltransferase
MLAPEQTLERSPGWSFDAPSRRDDLGTFARRVIWERYRDERIAKPVTVTWCDGLKLKLRLGNDISWCVFVGGMYEPNELALVAATLEEGMTFVDIGANEGLFTLVASGRVGTGGRVLALEPSSREFELLASNIELNVLRNVEPFRLALYNHAGSSRLTRAGFGHEGQNTIGDRIPNPGVSSAGSETVQLATLDAFVASEALERVDLVKLDTEGCEERILQGGQATLRRFLPILLIEIGPEQLAAHGSTVESLVELLADLDYRIWVFDGSGMPRLLTGDDSPLSSNIVAAPSGVLV